MISFTDRFEYTIDDKGRLSIPAKMRDQMQRHHQPLSLFVTPGPKGQLVAFAEAEHEEWRNLLGAQESEEAALALRHISSNTAQCDIDGQGRIILTPRLREMGGIKREVVILGVGKRIELWAKEKLAAFEGENSARVMNAMGALKARADLWG